MTKQEAEALIKKYGSQRAAAMESGIHRCTIQRALGLKASGSTKRSLPAKVSTQSKRSISEFRQEYDKSFYIPKKIDAALKELGTGWLYESEFCKMAGVNPVDLGNFRDVYADHIVQLKEGRRAWAGKPSLAKEMREMI